MVFVTKKTCFFGAYADSEGPDQTARIGIIHCEIVHLKKTDLRCLLASREGQQSETSENAVGLPNIDAWKSGLLTFKHPLPFIDQV